MAQTSPQRTTELLLKHLEPFKDEDPAWRVGESKIAGRGIFATRDIKRGDVIFRDSPIIIGPSARNADSLNACSVCFKMLPDTKFMCRNGCGLPVCKLCGKKIEHKSVCDLFKEWQPNEPDIANSLIIRLVCVAHAINLTDEQRDLIYAMQSSLDNNHRTEVRYAAKNFQNFPIDKKLIDIMNRTVAALRTSGFDEITIKRTNDNQEFIHRALFPLFGLMNHDCVPNSYYTFEVKTNIMTVHASVDIPKDTEITTTYTKLLTGNIARYSFLKTKKFFVCKCSRCTDPTEKGCFISALYCRNTSCNGMVVPEIKGMPRPDWNCLVCKMKSTHNQMMKAQDLASGSIEAKTNSKSLKTLIQYISHRSADFIPDNNYLVIDAKRDVIARLVEGPEDCGPEEIAAKAKYCQDILDVMDKMGLGDCLLRTYLETEKAK